MSETLSSNYKTFSGPDSVVDAYASALGLEDTRLTDIVRVTGAVSLEAAHELCLFFALNGNTIDRLDKLREVLHTEMPRLEEAEALIGDYSTDIGLP